MSEMPTLYRRIDTGERINGFIIKWNYVPVKIDYRAGAIELMGTEPPDGYPGEWNRR